MKKFTKILTLLLVIATIAACVAGCDFGKKKAIEGEKRITCYVTDDVTTEDPFLYILINDAKVENLNEKDYTKYTCTTLATDLKAVFDALRDNTGFTYEATYSDYGAYVINICGVTEDWDNKKYFSFYIDGEYSMTGISSTPLTENAVYTYCLEVSNW